jgi:glycosyltransferase involved in cell wall biosynthesis
MRIAIVHDQLQEFGGAERVLLVLKKIFPQADVYTTFYNPHSLGSHAEKFLQWKIITSWADKIPLLKKLYSPLRFITPWIWESLDLSNYDLVISSSGAYMAKGIITKPQTTHICYLHHQPRYLYYYETALEWQKYQIIKIYAHLINHHLRLWDYLSAQRVDYFIANSQETRQRINKFYRRDASVIYPPVYIPKLTALPKTGGDYYVTVSRLARAKHIDILIQAANQLKFKLKIIGEGRDKKYLQSLAGNTVEFLGEINDADFHQILIHAKGFLFAAVDEEFGIAIVEAMSYFLPPIAFASGGVPEIVKDGVNGYLFNRLTPEALIKKIQILEKLPAQKYLQLKKESRLTAEKFSEDRFKHEILKFVKRHARIA